MASWAPLSGLPFIFEDESGGTFLNTTLKDMYGRLSLEFTQSLSRPGREVTMIRIINSTTAQVNLVPNAVLDFSAGGPSGSIGTVMFPPASNMPMESYVKKVAAGRSSSAPSSLLCRRFLASDGQEYKWSLTGGPDKCLWTCSTSHTNYFVASYEQCDANVTNHDRTPSDGYNDQRVFSVGDTWVHLVTELLASLVVVRHMCRNELNYS